DNPNVAQPIASPTVNTTYTLTMTGPVSGGGTCSTTDSITVNVVAGPTGEFAGTDKVICKGGTVTLGTASQSGFTYAWSPGSYLSNVAISNPAFNAGTDFPVPNTASFTVTASKNGCSFTDQVNVSVLSANAGDDYCGPRTVGVADDMPAVSGKTFAWAVV